MALSVTHSKVSAIADAGDASLVEPSDWNATHTISGTIAVVNGGTGNTALAALTKADDTNVTLTLGGSPTTALVNAASITAGWTGTLAVTRGGSGTGTAFTAGSVLFAGASGVYSQNNASLFWDNSLLTLSLGSTASMALANQTPATFRIGPAINNSVFELTFSSAVSDGFACNNTNTGGHKWFWGDGTGDGGKAPVGVGTFTYFDRTTNSPSLGYGGDFFGVGGDVLFIAASTRAQSFHVYNTFSSSGSNYERAVFDWQTTANVLTIGTQAAGTGATRNLKFQVGGATKLDYGIANAATWTSPSAIMVTPVAVASLPAAGIAGRRHFVTDATVTTFASIVAGTGGNPVPVYDDGTNWRIG